MGALENKILELLYREYTIEYVEKNLDLNEEDLADIIIDLDDKGFITLREKKWVLTDKGKEIFVKRDEELKKLKISYLRGNINKEEFEIKKKELDTLPGSEPNEGLKVELKKEEFVRKEDIEEPKKIEEPKIINCTKCGTENRPESNFCRKCGTPFKKN